MLVQGKICPFLVKPVNIILLLFSINFKEASSKIKDLSRTLFAIEKLISSMEAVLSGSFASFKSLLIAKIGLNRTTMQELDRTQKRSLTGQ